MFLEVFTDQVKFLKKEIHLLLEEYLALSLGGDVNILVVFSVVLMNLEAEWGSMDTTWEEDYNEMFGWEQYANDQMMRDKSLREWNGMTKNYTRKG